MKTQVLHRGQHPYKHGSAEVKYAGGGNKNVKEALDTLYGLVASTLSWQEPVADKSSLPLTGNSINDTRVVEDDGDGDQAVYVCRAITGDVDAQWVKIADVDWGDAMENFEAMIEPTGFSERDDSTISFDDASLTFSIQPTATSFDVFEAGIKYTSTGDTLEITDTEGIHVIYYDEGVLKAVVNPTEGEVGVLIRKKSLVCILYWDVSEQEAIYVGEERHGCQMDGSTHSYLHFTNGLAYLSGLGLNTMDVDGSGDDTTAAQFGVDSGGVSDEDIYVPISSIVSTTGLPIYYMLGASAEWQKYTNAGYSVRTYDGTSTTRLAYNEYTGGAWQLTEVTNNDFVLCHIFATTEKDNPMIAIMGQDTYGNRIAARTGAQEEIYNLILDQVLFPEIRPIATVIFQTSDSYGNAVQARVLSTDDGGNYIDWREETISRTSVATTDHNSLTGLQGGQAGEYYHLTEDEHTKMTGVLETGVERGITHLTGAHTQTLGTAGTWYKIGGTWGDTNNKNFTTATDNKLTYDGDGNTFLMNGVSDLSVDTACTITYVLYKNGTIVTEAQTPHDFTSSAKTESISITSIIELEEDDYLEVWAKASVDGVDLTVSTLAVTFWGSC